MKRHCGDCQLCCRLLPVIELSKRGNEKCRHQRHHKGCSVYNTIQMPACCKAWNCRWILGDKTEALRRPDRSGYVIDVMPDFVTLRNDLDGSFTHLPVLQVWVDPARSDAWRDDKDFLAYLERLGAEEGMAALIRNGEEEAVFVAPPSINSDGTWYEQASTVGGKAHTPHDMAAAGFKMEMVLEESR